MLNFLQKSEQKIESRKKKIVWIDDKNQDWCFGKMAKEVTEEN